jgi:hypothetical protein
MSGPGSLFSSPSKQAQQTGSAIGVQDSNEIQSYESYVADQEQQARDAIAGMAAPNVAGYAVNPGKINAFAAPAPPSGNPNGGKPPTFTAPPVPKG